MNRSGNRGVASTRRHRGPGWRPAVALLALLGGCAVGPDFTSPAPPPGAEGTAYTPTPLAAQTTSAPGIIAGESQRLMLGQDIPAQWWTVFHSEALDALIRSALAQNPTLASAQAALRQSQEIYTAQTGALRYPNIGLRVNAERERAALATGRLGTYNLFNVGVDVSYQLDLFGGNTRALESYAAAVDYQRFQVEATYLTLVSNLVSTAILEASLRAQVKATREVLELLERQLKVVNVQFDAGAVARSAVLTQQTQIAQARATIPPLEKSLAQAQHQLSVLAGRLPSEAGMPEFNVDSLRFPQELPLTLPSSLVRQRPDIRASEALLHEASAQVGVATAAQYPQVTLGAGYGSASSTTSGLFRADSAIWNFGAGLVQPIFNGGQLSAQKRAAEAAYDQAQAQYRATVLSAFQNVADSLRAIQSDADTLRAQAEAESTARESLRIANEQYRLGAVSFLLLLDTQRSYAQTRIALVQAQAARYASTAALFQALGGGWWNEGPLADASRPGSGAVIERPGLAPVR